MTDAYLAPDPAAQHHAHADLQHHLAAELVGRQPSGVLQHRRHARQRRLVDTAQQRQGPAADQRPTADPATGHPRGAAELPADPDARYPCADRRQQHPVRPERLLLPADPADPALASSRRGRRPRTSRRRRRPRPHHPTRTATRSSTGRPRPLALRPVRPPRVPHRRLPGRPLHPWIRHRRRHRAQRPARRLPSRSCRRRPGRSPVAVRMSPQRFDELVADALDLIPAKLAAAIRQRRDSGRGPQPGGARPAGPVPRRRADRTRLQLRRVATRHDHDLSRRAAGHLRDRGRGGRRGGGDRHSRDRATTSASTTTGCTNSAGRERGNYRSSVAGAMNGP